MGRQKGIKVILKCNKCKFQIGLKGTDSDIKNSCGVLIGNHKSYSTECDASEVADFSLVADDKDKDEDEEEEDSYTIEAKKVIDKEREVTENIFKNESSKLDDVIGNEDVKNIIKTRLINYIEHKDKLIKLRKHPGAGLILAGIQGTGKTYIIRSAINDIIMSTEKYRKKYDVIILKSHHFMSGTVGESGKRIEAMLNVIRKYNKENTKETILVIDEIDSLAPDRETRSVLTSERTGSLLDEFGGIHDDHTIFLMGTTNKPERIDSEALVSGRFGTPLLVNMPTNEERWKMFLNFSSNMVLDESIDAELINEKFNNFPGRDMHQFVTDLQVIYFEKERKGEHHSSPVITYDDVIDLLESPNYRNVNKFNQERLNKLSEYYNRYSEDVKGSDISISTKAAIDRFIDEYIEIVPDSCELKDTVFEKFERCGYYDGMPQTTFTRQISKMLKKDGVTGIRRYMDGRRQDLYTNVRLKK